MKKIVCAVFITVFIALHFSATAQEGIENEKFRPQFHFTPQKHWMNDPNGMVFYNKTWHLFFQYYPDGTVWGPMHWGHATSPDLMHWTERPIALYPDSLGYIFSGSAVVDSANTSGFGEGGKIPLVAIFTYHHPTLEITKKTEFQYQGLAYSLDGGQHWTKYKNNPVLTAPGSTDFRDPKVSWYAPGKKWIMTLAVKDHICFYSSPNLKDWTKESEYGKTTGAHGGVWECPDLFPLRYDGKNYWVLLVSINPGASNGGSGTQYFIGDFDGHRFTPLDATTKWIDYGTDNYAGVTWFNTGDRRIFLGWMSNWEYARDVPTVNWRSAMTIPRELSLQRIDGDFFLSAVPAKEFSVLLKGQRAKPVAFGKAISIDKDSPFELSLQDHPVQDFSIKLSNDKGEKLVIGYEALENRFYVDRSAAGVSGFNEGFARKHYAPRLSNAGKMSFQILVDRASVELFADGGMTNMTEIFFPSESFSAIQINGNPGGKWSYTNIHKAFPVKAE